MAYNHRSFQQTIISGKLAQDPDVKKTKSGKSVANLSISSDGKRQEKAKRHRIILRDSLAEIAGKYLAKGDGVLIMGRIDTSKLEDKDNIVAYGLQITGSSQATRFC